MLSLSTALGRKLLPRLSVDQPKPDGLRTWLQSGSFHVEAGDKPDSITLKNSALTEIVPYVAYDYERFTLSALESLLFCKPEGSRRRAISWPLLKIYYSAFFAAHATMRAVGRGVVRLEPRQAKRLSEIASLFLPTLVIGAGSYHFQIFQNKDSSIDLKLGKLSDSGGAHEQFWRHFYSFLTEACDAVVNNNEPDAATVVAEISEIKGLLAANGFGSGTWLSSVRNQINYQHEYGVWFPYGAPAAAVEFVKKIRRVSSSIRLDYDVAKSPIQAFTACCNVIAAINMELSEALRRRPGTQRFNQLWKRLIAEDVTTGSAQVIF